MKKNFLVAVATVILVAGFATTVWSQTEKTGLAEKRFYVFFSQGSSEVPTSQKRTISEIKDYLAENKDLRPYFYGYRSQLRWRGTDSLAAGWSRSRDGGLLIESIESVAKAIGLETVDEVGLTTQPNLAWFKSMGQADDTPFVMVVVRQDPIAQLDGRVTSAQQTADSAYVLADEAKKNARTNASDISSLRQEFDVYKTTQKSNLSLLRVGFGTIAVSYTDIEPKAIPVLRLEANLSQRFGLQAEGGVVPVGSFNNEAVWDGVFHPAVFWRPASFIKILAGYSLATNFYESDFAIAESRDDGFLAGLELSAKLLGLNLYVGGGYLRSNADGGFITAGVAF